MNSKNINLLLRTSFIVFYVWLIPFASRAQDTGKPNVIMIYTDDHRYTGIHALGNQPVHTPNMDTLATTGISFDQTFLMGSFSGATCIPSRAMLLTGRQLFQLQGHGHAIPKTHSTMGEAFQKAGYNTYIVGKWHQDNKSLNRSFNDGATIMGRGSYLVDHFRMPLWDWDKNGIYDRKSAYLLAYDANGNITRRPLTANDKKGPSGTENTGPHTSEIFADKAAKFIKKHGDKTPFFMYLAFHAPHDPRQAPQSFKAKYPEDNMALTPSYMSQHPFDNGHLFLRDEALAPWPRTVNVVQKELSDYYAIITHLDEQIGKVIKALKSSGQYENTIIVLAGDSGLAVGNHGLLGKQNVYDEDGIHVPFIIAGGALPYKSMKSNALAYIHDIFPTLCDLANVPKPSSITGKSLLPVLRGETAEVRDYTYHAYKQFQRAIRKGDFKLIEYVRATDQNKTRGEFLSGSRVTQLFNIKNDPWETYDLSFLPSYQGVIENLRNELKQKAKLLGDKKENTGSAYDFWDFY